MKIKNEVEAAQTIHTKLKKTKRKRFGDFRRVENEKCLVAQTKPKEIIGQQAVLLVSFT